MKIHKHDAGEGACYLDALRHFTSALRDPEQWSILLIFEYQPSTGNLLWRARPHGLNGKRWTAEQWNRKHAGRIAGTEKSGDKPRGSNPERIKILLRWEGAMKQVGAHRIAWISANGPIPTGLLVDHRDQNPYNNILANLRLCTHGENAWNRKGFAKCGYKGVRFYRGGWQAEITHKGKGFYLGRHNTAEEAARAFDAKCLELCGEFAVLNFPTSDCPRPTAHSKAAPAPTAAPL